PRTRTFSLQSSVLSPRRYGFLTSSLASFPTFVSSLCVLLAVFLTACFRCAPVFFDAWLSLRAALSIGLGVGLLTPVTSLAFSFTSFPFALSARCAPLDARLTSAFVSRPAFFTVL